MISLRTMKHTVILAINLLAFCPLIYGQTDTGLVKYNPEFKFNEGIFLNFEQVRNNQPVAKSRILADVGFDDPHFYDRVLEDKKISFYDNYGVKQEISTRNIWGYSRNGVLYININAGYYRITIVGAICHFVANLTTYSNDYYTSPYPYYNYGYPYGRQASHPTTEMRQYLLDFSTGRIMEYDIASVEVLLMKDPELYDEFMALRNKKKKQLKFLYIRKFNERNPLYFPVH